MSERRFTEEQVAAIIRRAAERPTPGAPVTPFSVGEAELIRIAAELGIGETTVREAIARESAWSAHEEGGPGAVSRTLTRTFHGLVPEDALSAVHDELFPLDGKPPRSGLGGSLLFSSWVGMAACQINVARKPSATTVKLRSDASAAGFAAFGPALFASGIAGAIVHGSEWFAVADRPFILAFVLAAVWGLAWWGFRTLVRRTNRKIEACLERACAAIAEAVRDPSPHLGEGVDLSAEPAESTLSQHG